MPSHHNSPSSTRSSPTSTRRPHFPPNASSPRFSRTSRSFSFSHSRQQSFNSSSRRAPVSLTERATSLAAQGLAHGNKLRKRFEAWFWTLKPWQKAGVVLLILTLIAHGILVLIYHEQIFQFIAKTAKGWRALTAGWLILWMLTAVVSFPPLIGYSTCVMLGGWVYGVPQGWYIVATGSTIGATMSFIICRNLLSKFVTRLTARNPEFAALALTLKHDGFKLLIMIRLCPLPFSITNGALSSIPTVSPLKFFFATLIASPKLLLHVWIGQQMAELAERGDKMDLKTKAVSYIGIILGSIFGGVTGWWIYKQTKKRAEELRELEAERGIEAGGELPNPEEFEDDDDDDDDDDDLDLGNDPMAEADELLSDREEDITSRERRERDRLRSQGESWDNNGSYHDETESSDDLPTIDLSTPIEVEKPLARNGKARK